MSFVGDFELPADRAELNRKAVRLEWLTIAFLITAIVLLALTLGQSQAMKAAWIEDMLSLLPPIAFLIANRVRYRRRNREWPWGFHRAVSVAYVFASLALLVMGVLLVGDSALKLVMAEHPPIGVVKIFGETIWLGWLMLVVLAYTAVVPVILGRMKQPLAAGLHDKVLYADAEMNRADWLTAVAAMIGVVGIGLGLWWLDGVAAIVIGADIARDGWRNVRRAIEDLMDRTPMLYDGSGRHPIRGRVESAVREVDWVEDFQVRLREDGHVFVGEVLVKPRDERAVIARCEALAEELKGLDWRLHDLVVAPASEIGPEAAQQE